MARKPRDKSEELARTLFVQNLTFSTTEEDLRIRMEEYGKVAYCKVCVDKDTGMSRGSAFVCFTTQQDAERVLQEAYLFVETGIRESTIELNGRQLVLQKAITRDEAATHKATKGEKKVKDSRNKNLAMLGYKTQKEYTELGLTSEEVKLRMQAQMEMNRKLKNVNFVVNKQRLCVRNLPKNVSKAQVKEVFEPYCTQGKVVNVKLMKVNGRMESYAFVTFSSPEDALNVMKNVNDTVQFPQKRRLMLEFSVDNMLRLHKYKQMKAAHDALEKAKKVEGVTKNKALVAKARTLPEVVEKEEQPSRPRKGRKQPTRKEVLAKRFAKKKNLL